LLEVRQIAARLIETGDPVAAAFRKRFRLERDVPNTLT
jgi:hypothetical protein